TRQWRLQRGRGVPSRAAVRADLNERDTAIPGERDDADLRRSTHDRIVRWPSDNRYGVDSTIQVLRVRPAFLLPVSAELALNVLDLREPFRVEHSVQPGDDDARRIAMGGLEGTAVHVV